MKTSTRVLFLLLFILTTKFGFAQLNYQVGGFSTFGSTYTDLGSTGTAITMNNNDSGHSASIAFPAAFTFTYNFHTYTSFVMYVDGFIKLGNGTGDTVASPTNLLYTAFSNVLGTLTGGPFNNSTTTAVGYSAVQDSSLVVPFGEDLYAGSNTPDFRYALTGTFGTRTLTIQWKNIKDKLQCGAPTQYDTINFQVKLYEGTNAIEFVYGYWAPSSNTSTAHFAACGLKGNDCVTAQLITLTKGSAVAWSSPTINAGNYTVNALNFGNNVGTARPAPDLGRVYHFNPIVYNDAAVQEIRAMGKVAIPAYVADSIKVKISNPGLNALTSLVVTLSVSGANTYSTTRTISSLASGASIYVSFPPYTPTNLGASLITISVPTDDNNTNNTNTYSLSVTSRTLGYTDTTRTFSGSNGSVSQIYACKYKINGTRLVTSVKFFIPSNSTATGVPVTGVVIDSTNTIVGSSSAYTLLSTDMGTYVTLNILSPPNITNTFFYAGIAVGSNTFTAGSFLNIYQNEGNGTTTDPPRPEVSYYFSSLTAGSAPIQQYNGRSMIECTVDPDTTDVGISASIPANNGVVPTGIAIPLRAYVKNFGTVLKTAGLSVKYSVDGGTAVGPLTTNVSLNQNDTTSVYFTGTNAFTLSTAGAHIIKIYTSYATDQNRGNDTLVLNISAVAPITTYPYRLANGILTTWTPINNTASLWNQTTATQPNGVSASTVLYANNTGVAGYPDAKMQSPIFSFVGISHPTLHFYVAHAPSTTSGRDDSLQVLVSTNGGATYNIVYTRSSQLSSPSLGTVAATSSTTYTPAASTDWRHETVDLSAYSGNSYVVIAFREKSAQGSNVFLSDIIISNPITLSTQAVTTTNTFVNGILSIGMTTAIGASTGQLYISRYNSAPYSSASPVFATNSAATTNSGGVFTPNNVSPDNWWTITYSGIGTGNLPSTVPYYVIINYSGIGGITRPDSLYIMRRSENNGSWIALPTTRSSTTLLTGPVTGFSDFGIGSTSSYNTLPVSWLNISAKKVSAYNLIEWKTANEINNDHYVIERSENNIEFNSIGEIASSPNSNSAKNYSFIDKDLLNGVKIIYYRIKQVDHDGASTFSKVVSVQTNDIVSPIVAFPNPFNKDLQLTLNTNAKEVSVIVFDLSGREVYSKKITTEVNAKVNLTELNKLENGFYIMNVLIDGETHVLKINKVE